MRIAPVLTFIGKRLTVRTLALAAIASFAFVSSLHRGKAAGSISLTTFNTAYTQDFNTLANTGTSSTVPNGWDFLESGTNANTTYTAGAGTSTTGDTYSFGTGTATDRAFGGLRSGALIPIIGASFTNNIGG